MIVRSEFSDWEYFVVGSYSQQALQDCCCYYCNRYFEAYKKALVAGIDFEGKPFLVHKKHFELYHVDLLGVYLEGIAHSRLEYALDLDLDVHALHSHNAALCKYIFTWFSTLLRLV